MKLLSPILVEIAQSLCGTKPGEGHVYAHYKEALKTSGGRKKIEIYEVK